MSANEELLARLKIVECPDATAPLQEPALVMARARGATVVDAAGREYVDLCAGFGALALGHAAPALRRVFAEYGGDGGEDFAPLVHGMGDVYASTAKVELIEELLRHVPPSLTRAALALTGAQAVEIAVKTAMLATGRAAFVTFEGGYHGLDLGILPLTARQNFRAPFREYLPAGRVRTLPLRAPEAVLDEAFAALATVGGVAAVVVEPVQGRAGVRPAGGEWLATLRRVCDRYGALLVYDEVFTGLGRSGRMTFAHEVACDLLCLGKALGGGLPLSACVGTERAMTSWPRSTGEALHTGTFFGHPLACAVATATLREIAAQDLPGRAARIGGAWKARLTAALAGHPVVREVRGEGLMLAVELATPGLGARLMDRLRARGVIALASGEQGECLSLTPPLTIAEADLARAEAVLFDGLNLMK